MNSIVRLRFLFIISWITSHLGKNPRNGGIPANDIIVIMVENLIKGLFLLKKDWEIKLIFDLLNMKITAEFKIA